MYGVYIFYVDTHALVHFVDEDKTSIVPLRRLDKKDDLCTGDTCSVAWTDKKKYQGTLIFSGIFLIVSTTFYTNKEIFAWVYFLNGWMIYH